MLFSSMALVHMATSVPSIGGLMKVASMRILLRTIGANLKPMQSHVSEKKCWRSMTMYVAHFNNKASQR
jgi:hypothetical protein